MGGAAVSSRVPIGNDRMVHEAILAGEIDLHPVSLGTALCSTLQLPPDSDLESARTQVQRGFREQFHLEWMAPLGFSTQFRMVIRGDSVASGVPPTLSQAAKDPRGWVLGITREFQDRLDGVGLLMRKYALTLTRPQMRDDPKGLFEGLAQGRYTMIVAHELDPRIDAGPFLALEDDARAFPPQEVGLAVRLDALQRIPDLASKLTVLTGKITPAQMKRLLHQVDMEDHLPKTAAAELAAALA